MERVTITQEFSQTQRITFEGFAKSQQIITDITNGQCGTLGRSDCPTCHGKGFVFKDDLDTLTRIPVWCDCIKGPQADRWAELSGNPRLKEQTLERLEEYAPWVASLKKKAFDYVEHIRQDSSGWWYLSGQSGCGKTHTCSGIFLELMKQGKRGEYASWGKTMRKLSQAKFKGDVYESVYNRLVNAPLLYWDDFFKKRAGRMPTDDEFEFSFDIINERYNDPNKITLFSSEIHIQNISSKFDEAIGTRIYERCNNGGFWIHVDADPNKNYRTKI